MFGLCRSTPTSRATEVVGAARAGVVGAAGADVTREDVIAVQNAWAGAIKKISRIYIENGDYVQAAATAAGELYAYGKYEVLFKPTKAAQHQFRPKAEDAMSYFVGCKAVEHGYAEDGGFAINGGKGWSDCVCDNHQITLNIDVAIAMGNYYFTCATTGEKSKVEYTFGYKRCDDGKVRIFLHHSSVPYDVSGKAADPKGHLAASVAAVTREDVIAVQNAWAGAIKHISRIYMENGDYVQAAATAAGELYAYGKYDVLFKPTKAAQHQFRPKAEDAMSYFVGCKSVEHGYAEDGGFAINGGMGWSDCVYDNHQIDLNCHVAIAMGNYYFTCATTGEKSKVEYTFGYQRCDDGKVRIFLHHSSVPYDVSGKAADPRGHLAASTAAVTREDAIAVQNAWAGAIKNISRIYMENGDYVQAAATAAGELYAYGKYDVLFKPTKAAVEHGYAEDGGFAINGGKGWSDCVSTPTASTTCFSSRPRPPNTSSGRRPKMPCPILSAARLSNMGTLRTEVLRSMGARAGRIACMTTTRSISMVMSPSPWATTTSPAQQLERNPKSSTPLSTNAATTARCASSCTIRPCRTRPFKRRPLVPNLIRQ
ncbi:unnamed protein product [Prorocentrum cordatum]|uniref:Uncharacterized protein n=1 Tax=Prorocentrum cordatum TaxID=2364126 RepID=A0ABN9WY62_9DINO|nr:unnamed protein product [Polarella glacialis]